MQKNSDISLANTEITNLENNDSTISNFKGVFEVSKSGNYLFEKEGYSNIIFELRINSENIIQLEINPLELNEVTIHANQIPKTLKKAATSVHIISARDLKLSNNIDFNPILNRVPGVFM